MSVLNEYYEILDGKKRPRFKRTNLRRKIERACELLKCCVLCEHRCGINREISKGFCGARDFMEISSYFPHYGEEEFLVPSFTVFFMGCNFKCVFCQNYTISQRMEREMVIQPQELARIIEEYSWCKNVNFVGGEPTPYLPFILQTLYYTNSNIPVVWNSNFYMSEESMELLRNTVDIYLSDWKYGNDRCAERLSGIKNYWDVVSRNHDIAFNDGILVIRHLILPNHIECCSKPILEYISENYGDKVIVNLMPQYRPEYLAHKYPEISRRPEPEELKKVWSYAEKLGLNWIH
jgi:putative pyruvate formate lyase activating enzyme